MEHPLSRTTHTLDMAQVGQLAERLAAAHAPAVTVADLGLEGAAVPPSAVLTKVWWRGSPEFPDIFGDFGGPGEGGSPATHVQLHTKSLVELSRRLGLRHHWGV